MSLSQKNEDLYWATYIKFLKHLTGDNGKDRMVFICPDSAQGILASKAIPTAMTNKQLFEKADSLVTPGNPIFLGDRSASYADFVEMYLDNVEIAKDMSQGAKDAVDAAQKIWNASTKALRETRKQAITEYNADTTPNKPDMVVWASSNYGELGSAIDNEATAFGDMRQAVLKQVGPNGEQWIRASRIMKNLRDAPSAIPGLTMPTASDSSLTVTWKKIQDLNQAGWNNEPPALEPAITECSFEPEYTIMQYRNDMDEWVNSYEKYEPDTISLETLQTHEESVTEKHETEEHAHATADWLGFIRLGNVDYTKKDTTGRVNASNDFSEVNFKFSWKHHKLFDVIPGKWHVPSLWDKFKLKQGAEIFQKDYFRPVQFLCVDGLGIEAKLSGSVKQSFDDKQAAAQTTSGGAGLRIGLFGVSGDGGKSSTDERTTHEAKYDSATGTIKLLPRQQFGTSSLIAVIGQRIHAQD